ncbi:uncharacterized protein LTR77_008703 [Saxophila tyrrhenica]|uniref:Uncharacterized protein n=1 Tax=Saxophila tyrrhenica TaxID=1690608 RepID=A0AAV9P1Z2_9PEZI|nr:hypothetical protein LTR77_008703 [Saxophila tyrrhenica]
MNISAAISRPVRNQNDLTTSEHMQYEVAGEANDIVANVLHTSPDGRCLKEILTGHMDIASTQLWEQTIRGMRIQNEIYSWDCQDYVIEMIDTLENVGLLGSFENYTAVKNRILQMRGTIEETYRLVRDYDPATLEAEDEHSDVQTSGESEDSLPQHVRSEELIVDSDDEYD